MVDESENLTFEIEVIIKYSAFSDQKFIFKVVLYFLFLCVITAQFELTVENGVCTPRLFGVLISA